MEAPGWWMGNALVVISLMPIIDIDRFWMAHGFVKSDTDTEMCRYMTPDIQSSEGFWREQQ